jgi:hypothetical protein
MKKLFAELATSTKHQLKEQREGHEKEIADMI